MSEGGAWHDRRERGSIWGMRFTAWLYRHVGRGLARSLLYPIVGYFYLTDRHARAASRQYLERLAATEEGRRALGGPPGRREVFRHLMEFGIAILDRLGFWLGRKDDFELSIEGYHHLERITRERCGAIVVGAHLGSFDVMRLVGDLRSVLAINVFMYTEHAESINRVFRELDAEGARRVRVVPIRRGSFGHAIEARRCVERGEVVAVLADRLPPHEADRATPVRFLGATARLPQGPWHLAALLGCPVLLMLGLRTGPGRYRVVVESIAESLSVPRSQRSHAVQETAQAYADRLAHYCCVAPYQWFNFYEFWGG